MDDLVKCARNIVKEATNCYGQQVDLAMIACTVLSELADSIEAQAAEITALRAQLERDWIGERLRWEKEDLYLGPFRVATASIGFGIQLRTKDGLWRGLLETDPETGFVGAKGFPTEAEARAAVEAEVREALGVKS